MVLVPSKIAGIASLTPAWANVPFKESFLHRHWFRIGLVLSWVPSIIGALVYFRVIP
jgi:hypothetical protein